MSEPLSQRLAPRPLKPGTELAAEAIAIKIRWFGLLLGLLLANLDPDVAVEHSAQHHPRCLALIFTAIDTAAFQFGPGLSP